MPRLLRHPGLRCVARDSDLGHQLPLPTRSLAPHVCGLDHAGSANLPFDAPSELPADFSTGTAT